MRSTAGKKKVKQIFKFEKVFTTCSKLIISELGYCPTGSDNVWFDNNEHVSLTVFTFGFCFMHAEHKLLTVFRKVLYEIERNQSNLLTFKN